MKFSSILLFSFLVSSSSFASMNAVDKVFYGSDDRVLARDLNRLIDKKYIKSSKAVLAQVSSWRLSKPENNSVSVVATSFQKGFNICSYEDHLDEPALTSCSAFLIAPDVIMTAAHCIPSSTDCKKNQWILDFEGGNDFKPPYSKMTIPASKLYSCKEIISSVNNNRFDYAIIRLDRKILDRKPLELNTDGLLQPNTSLYVVGHPLGLPKMVSKHASIVKNINDNYFVINSDTFNGNSGSPVINTNTNKVEGLIIRGEDDFELDVLSGCNRVKRCSDSGIGCRGESVQKIHRLPLKSVFN